MNLHGFELIQEQYIKEYQMNTRWFRHRKTGAELVSLENNDNHKVFSINFRTIPKTSNGVAHILEHSVLNGSKKYPVKEPFIELIKSSLQTFVNAFTYPDKTCYPCASQNLQDFYNLIDVYMDAVLHPLLKSEVLDQEGWHYELNQPEDELKIKGVVYNEMRGAYSDAEDRLTDIALQNLFDDDHPYNLDSGGDPSVIPELTYDDFVDFHKTYYHPTNARVFFYGNDSVEERLRLMNEYFEGFERLDLDSSVPMQAFRKEALQINKTYAASSDEDGHFVTINYLLPEINTSFDAMKWSMLYYILFGTAASPLHKDLIDSGLGDGLAGYGLESEMQQWSLSLGMKGVPTKNIDKIADFIQESLAKIEKNGIDKEMIKAAMNSIEFSLRENNSGSYPRGLMLMLSSLAFWNYDKNPIDAIAFEKPLNELKKAIQENDRFFESIIKESILENPHYVVVKLSPDQNLESEREAREVEKLAQIKESFSEKEIVEIIKNTKALVAFQETPNSSEALASLPMLDRDDLELKIRKIPTEKLEINTTPVYCHQLDTNGILYLTLGFDVQNIPENLLPYFGIFSALLTQMGTADTDFVRLIQRMGKETGGIYGSLYSAMKLNSKDFTTYYFVQGKCLVSQTDALLSLFKELLTRPNLDIKERFLQVVLQMRVNLDSLMVPYGHVMVQKRINGMMTPTGWLTELTSGISYLHFLRSLEERIQNDWAAVQTEISQIWSLLINRETMLVNTTVTAEEWPVVAEKLKAFVEDLPASKSEIKKWDFPMLKENQGYLIPAQVNYVGKGMNLKDILDTDHGSLQVAAGYLSNSYIWDQVRVMGGAYGGAAGLGQLSGTFSYQSYRDPNVFKTIEAYDGAEDFMRELELDKTEVTKAVIATIAKVDAPLMPDQKGHVALKWLLQDITDDYRQNYRNQILSTTMEDMRGLADVLAEVKKNGTIVVLGNEKSLEEANASLKEKLVLKKI